MGTENDRDTARLRAELRQLLAEVDTDEFAHLSAPFAALLAFLLEHSDFGANVVYCSYCGHGDMPVTAIDVGGSKPKYVCPTCYGDNVAQDSEPIEARS